MFKGLGSRESPDHLLCDPGVTQDEQDEILIPVLAWLCCGADLSISGQLLGSRSAKGEFGAGGEFSPCYMQ